MSEILSSNPDAPEHPDPNPTDVTRDGLDNTQIQLHAYRVNEQGHVMPAPASTRVEEQIHDYYSEIRQQLMEGLRSNEEGLDMVRVRSFMSSLGFESDAHVLVLDDEDYALYEKRYSTMLNASAVDRYGSFAPGVNIVAVRRNAEDETKFGPGVTEYKVLHELLHSSAHNASFLYTVEENGSEDPDIQVRPGRSGQISGSPDPRIKMRGSFLEEGLADNVAQRYVRDELGLTGGFGENSPIFVSCDEGIFEIPPDVQRGGDGNKENVASIGIELLLRADPSLFDSFVKARKDPRGLQEVAAKITAIGTAAGEPNLYKILWNCEPNIRSFCDAAMTVAWTVAPELASQWQEDYVEPEDDDEEYD